VAEWSKALVLGTSPQGRGFESHRCQIYFSFAAAAFADEVYFSPLIFLLICMWLDTFPYFLNFHDNLCNFFCYQGRIVNRVVSLFTYFIKCT
jgi:hypothetical protein